MRPGLPEVEADGLERGSLGSYALLGATLFAVLACVFLRTSPRLPVETSMVRIWNDTGIALQNVRVNGIAFGDLAAGGASEYRG